MARSTTDPLALSGKPRWTLESIDRTIRLMEKRKESGQGDYSSSMCRLSLPMTQELRARLEAVTKERDKLKERKED